jgi:uncharacterized protein (TIGR00251 family)
MIELQSDPRGVIVSVRAQPGARRNGIVGEHDGMLRVAVTAAPEKGKANKAIVDVLSRALGVPKSAVVLLSGETSSRKRFLIQSGIVEVIRRAIDRILAPADQS